VKRLKILTPTYYALFAHDYSFTIKIYYNKLNEEEYNLKEFNAEAAASSILLEQKDVNLKKYFEFVKNPDAVNRKEVALLDDLVKVYEFAQKRDLTGANIIKTHTMLSKSLLPPKQRGQFRTVDFEIKNFDAKQVYKAPSPKLVEKYFDSLLNDIQILFKREMRLNLCFYYASYLHIGFHQVSPFFECNGIMARLLEKWFLASKLDRRAWLIPSEKFYYNNAKTYYQNFGKIGKVFANINNENALDFSLMLPNALEEPILQE
jgi:Fic family protein